jgi:hypothetical protein
VRARRYRRAKGNPFLHDGGDNGNGGNGNGGGGGFGDHDAGGGDAAGRRGPNARHPRRHRADAANDNSHGNYTDAESDADAGFILQQQRERNRERERRRAEAREHIQRESLPPLSTVPTLSWAPALEYSLPPRVERVVARKIRAAKRDIEESTAANMDFWFPSRRIGYNEVSVGGGFSGKELVEFYHNSPPRGPRHEHAHTHTGGAHHPSVSSSPALSSMRSRGTRVPAGGGGVTQLSPPKPVTAPRPIRTGRPAIPQHILASTRGGSDRRR